MFRRPPARARIALAWFATTMSSPLHAETPAEEEAILPAPRAAGPWSIDIEAGYRAQGTSAYRGFYLAPGLWFAAVPGIELGLFVPLHIRNSPRGRVGIDLSIGLEPRLRFALREDLGAEVAIALAGEDQDEINGVISYGAGLQIGTFMNLRYTYERYNLSSDFYLQGGTGDASANFLDVAFTGRAGQRLAYAEIVLLLLLAATTSGAR